MATAPGSTIEEVALAMGPGSMFEDPEALLRPLREAGGTLRVLFLDATTDTLVQRYEGTKRRHPVAGETLAAAIEHERRQADALRAVSDVVIDTSDLSVHELRARIEELIESSVPDGLNLSITSFGYKHGLPRDADLVFDVRFLPNPHWDEQLRPLSGLDPDVRAYAFTHPAADPFLDQVSTMLDLLLPEYEKEGRAYLSIAFGCTGGHHRSVAVAEEIASRLREQGRDPALIHRDVTR